jgi:hypothetical protein
MNLEDFKQEYWNLSVERRNAGLRALLNELARDPERYENFLYDIMVDAENLEGDDYFGTEGLNV